MTFDEYQELAMRTHNPKLSTKDAQACYALGLAGEAGEAADYIKKVLFHGHPFDRQKLVKELGDVDWYKAAVAKMFGISANEIAEANIAKLRARYPEGFSEAASQNRKDGDT